MAPNTLITLLLVLASLLLAVLLFIAGAIWRGRVTSGTMDFRTRERLVCFAVARDWARIRSIPGGWSGNEKCAPSSALFWRVEVPSGAQANRETHCAAELFPVQRRSDRLRLGIKENGSPGSSAGP